MDNSDVLLLVKAGDCGFCKKLAPYWSSIEKDIKAKYPNLRIQVVDYISIKNGGVFDPTKIPNGIGRITGMWPSLFYIPGPLWDSGVSEMSKGKSNPVNFLVASVHGFNYKLRSNDGKLRFEPQQNTGKSLFKSSDIIEWISTISKPKESTKKIKTLSTEKNIENPKEPIQKQSVEKVYNGLQLTSGGYSICPRYKKLKPKK